MNRVEAGAELSVVREGIRTSRDRRVAATRARIYDAVRQLAEADTEITVSSIVSAAGVGRATFYTHFADLEDLAMHLQDSAFQDIAAQTRSIAGGRVDEDAMLRSQRALIAHYAAYRPLYAGSFAVPVARGVESRVAELMGRQILAHLESVSPPPVGISPQIAAAYIAHAATGVIVSWLLGDIDVSEDELARHLTRLMPRWMHSASS